MPGQRGRQRRASAYTRHDYRLDARGAQIAKTVVNVVRRSHAINIGKIADYEPSLHLSHHDLPASAEPRGEVVIGGRYAHPVIVTACKRGWLSAAAERLELCGLK